MADTKLHPDAIRTDGGTQPRGKIDDEVVQRYVEALKERATFPPITVYYDGEHYWLADGFHRLKAFRELKRKKVPAEVHQGSRREAILHAVGANAEHGLPRTREDVHRAIDTLLRDQEWSKWSDREIARWCKVHHSTVSARRKNLHINQATVNESSKFTSNTSLANLASEKTPGSKPSLSNLDSEKASGSPLAAPGEGESGETVKRRYRTRHGTISEMQVPVRPRTANGVDQAEPPADIHNANSDTGEAETDELNRRLYDARALIEQARRIADGDKSARPASNDVAMELSRLTGTAVFTQRLGYMAFGERDRYDPGGHMVGDPGPSRGEIWFRFSSMLQEAVWTARHLEPEECANLTPLAEKREAREILTYVGAWIAQALKEMDRTYRDPDEIDPEADDLHRPDTFGLRRYPLTGEEWELVRGRQKRISDKTSNND